MKEDRKKDSKVVRKIIIAMLFVVVLTGGLYFAYLLTLATISSDVPLEGVYYCERIDTTYYVDKGMEKCLSFPNGNTVSFARLPWNGFHGIEVAGNTLLDVLARGTFYWNQETDVLYIYFEEFPGEIGWNRLCKFERVE